MTITEKVSYLKGLADGLGIDASSNEGKVLRSIIDVLEDMAAIVADLDEEMLVMSGTIEEIDEDLGLLEEEIYSDDECDCDDECGCGRHHHHHYDDDDFNDEVYYEVECPNCGEEIYLDGDLAAEGEVECPNCGEEFEFDLEDDDDEPVIDIVEVPTDEEN